MDELKMLQLVYAGALADAAYHYEKNGILEKVTAEKKLMQDMAAARQLAHWDIKTLEEAYDRLSRLFGCAPWQTKKEDDEVVAKTSSCLLCAIAKKQGAGKPCEAFCINPFASYAKNFGYELSVESTLWEGDSCRFVNKKK